MNQRLFPFLPTMALAIAGLTDRREPIEKKPKDRVKVRSRGANDEAALWVTPSRYGSAQANHMTMRQNRRRRNRARNRMARASRAVNR